MLWNEQRQPTSPPPAFIPQQPTQFQPGQPGQPFGPAQPGGPGGPQLYAVDPGAIRGCLYRYTYIWLRGYQSFWFYPTYVGRESVAGYRWTGYNWVYFGIDLQRIQSFQCV